MIYLCAQPDSDYFLWQIDILLKNFNDLGIPQERIHVIIGYDKNKGINQKFLNFSNETCFGTFYFYSDSRRSKKYISSIRSNIIKQHFWKFKYLEREIIFYHDCDIIFRELPDEKLLANGNTWYVSDTRKYLDSNYIKSFSIDLFNSACSIVNIDPKIVEFNDNNAGGAQYILKKLSYQFWNEIEENSEKIFEHFQKYNITNDRKIQSWCADMWALLWTGLKYKNRIRIHKELEFCWPKDTLDRWFNTKILHNAGVLDKDKQSFFSKTLFTKASPTGIDTSRYKNGFCTSIYADKVDLLEMSYTIDASDFIFIFDIDLFSHVTENYLNHFSRYIIKNFKTQVFIIQNDVLSRINENIFLNAINFRMFQNASQRNSFINSLECDFVCIIEAHYILTKEQIYNSIMLMRNKNMDFLRPYDRIKIFSEQSFYHFQFDLQLSTVENKLFELYYEKKFDKSVYFFKKKLYSNFVKLTCDNIALRCGIKDLLEIKLIVLQMNLCVVNEFISIYMPRIAYENNKNQITYSKYLNISNFDKKRLMRDLKFSKKKRIKASINDPKIALALLKENNNQKSLQKTIDSFRTLKLEYQEIYENFTVNSFLKNALTSAVKNKIEYLILCDRNIKFVTKNVNVEIMTQIKIMENYHLYIGYCGVRGNKLTVQRYSDNILAGENISHCPLFIICKNVFREILINIKDDTQNIIKVFDNISTKKFIIFPFFAEENSMENSDISESYIRAKQYIEFIKKKNT